VGGPVAGGRAAPHLDGCSASLRPVSRRVASPAAGNVNVAEAVPVPLMLLFASTINAAALCSPEQQPTRAQ